MGDVTRQSYNTGWAGYNKQVMNFAGTCPASCTGMAVWIAGNRNYADTVYSLKWNGDSLTKQREIWQTNYHSMWTLESPDIGAYTLVLTWQSDPVNWMVASVCWFTGSKPGDMVGQTAIHTTGGTVYVTAGSEADLVLAGGTNYSDTTPAVSGGDLTSWFQYQNNEAVGYKESPSTVSSTACNFVNDSTASALVIKGVLGGGPASLGMFYKRYQDFMDRLRQGLIPQNQLKKEYGQIIKLRPQPVKLLKIDKVGFNVAN